MSNEHILNELKGIKAILAFSNSKIIEQRLSEIIKTKPRRLMWIYCDGTRSQTEIAELVGVSQPAVSYFLTEAKLAGIVDYSQGKEPFKVLDYVPPAWLDLVGDKIITDDDANEERRTLDEFK